jgi:hypothetical protein
MIGSLLVSLALLAPPPGDAVPEVVDPIDREYAGPISMEAETDAVPEVSAPDRSEAAPVSGSVQTAPAGDATVQLADVEDAQRRPVPRLLSTIERFEEDEEAYFGKKVKFYPGLQVRNHIGYVSDFQIDRHGNNYSEGGFSTGRIRWNPRLDIRKKLVLVGMLDLVNGRWAPSGSDDPIIDEIIHRGQPPVPATLGEHPVRFVDFRELYLQWNTSVGVLRLGQQAFTWGEGILANSGNYNDRFGDMRFGDDSMGNIYERILFATKPFKYRPGRIKDLVVAIGGDLVYRDSRVDLRDGDIAGQVLGVLRYQPEHKPGTWLGGYMVYRNQRVADDGDVYPDDRDLQVGVADIGGQGTLWLRDRLQLIGSFEGAMIFGGTTVARDELGTHKVLQGGAAGRAYIGHHDTWLVGFDTGYASGDPNPNDRWVNNFVFDAGHNVGLLMFRQINGWRTARSEMLATDGQLTGVPLNGTQFIPTQGGVTNAVYIHPKARYSLWERLEVWGGPLIVAAPVPVVDPYATRLAGGAPTNSVGGDGGRRFYGTELDIGIRARFDIRNFWLQAGLQGGLLMPGPALANAAGETGGPVGGVWFRTEVRY